MRRRSTYALVSALVFALLLVGTSAGCKRVAEVTSFWPFAEKEREAAKPPAPLIFPYTGAKAPSREAVVRRPLSVKIENSPASRPQTGLNSADVVYETISEGGITRFNCIYQSTIPPKIGPVRSARLSDLWIVPQYDALFFFSGASTANNRRINEAGLPNLSQDAGVSEPYSRSSARPAPHNLYLDPRQAYRVAKARGHAITVNPVPLKFAKRSEEPSAVVNQLTVPFSPANTSRWTYDSSSRNYLRENNGTRHIDEATGKQVSSRNVVVLWAQYKPVTRDRTGSSTFDIVLGGKGRVSVFHDGGRWDGTWTAQRNAPPRFTDASGRPIRLAVGRTWFEVVPLNVSISMK